MLITTIRPKLDRDEATRRMRGPVREMRRGRLEAVLDFYVPYRLFEVSISSASKNIESLVAVDSVTGELDLYTFDAAPADEEEEKVETDRAIKATISEARAFSILKEKVPRTLRLKGLFRVRSFQLKANCVARLHVPYWIGIYRRGDATTLDVLDALKGSFESEANREMLGRWLDRSGVLKVPPRA